MKTTAAKILTVAIATALCGSAFAEQKAHDEMAGAGAKDRIEAEMRIMDANHDGKVSAAEHEAGAQEMFKGMDANQDNRVTAEEMDATQKPFKSHDASHGNGHELSSAEKIKVIDTNGDGALTAQEHAAGAKTMFTKMDTDKDGNLTAAEIKTGHQQMMMSKDE
jgi:Ca2+-binding EF-hand superfamily protein